MFRGLGIVLVSFVLFFGGCSKSAAIYNVEKAPLKVKDVSNNDIFKAVKRAGAALGWEITKVDDNEAIGVLKVRRHIAKVFISYDAKSYSIKYLSSFNLKHHDKTKNRVETIHRHYNKWIKNLEKGIATQLELL